MYKLLTSTVDEYVSGFVRNQGNRDSQLKGDHIAAERGHMYMMIKMSDLFGFVIDLEKIIYGLGFKLILKRNNNDRALFRVNADADAVANDANIDIREISWCVPSIDPSNDNRIIVQKGLIKKNNVHFSYYDIMNVTECYCKIGSEFYPEDRMNINYGTNNYNEAFKEFVSFNKDYNGLPHNIKPYINHRTFKSIYKIYVFVTRYQSDHIGPQPIQLNFKFSAAVADTSCISIKQKNY